MIERFLGLPELASKHGAQVDQTLGMVHLLMLVLFVVWSAFFVFLVWRFRAKRQPRAEYRGLKTRASLYAEIGVAVAEALILVGLSIPLYSELVDRVPEVEAREDALVVRVVAQQYAWNVHYPGADGLFGRTDPSLVDEGAGNPLGLDPDDAAGDDDIVTINQLHLPVDRPTVVYLTSKDVIHGFFLPQMRIKQDAIPGLEFAVWLVPEVTTQEMRERLGDDTFDYEIACAQLCGVGHYRMRGILTVVTSDELDSWLEGRQPSAEDDFWL